ALQKDAQLEKDAADVSRLNEEILDVTQQVAEERIKVASASFALRKHQALLSAAKTQLKQEGRAGTELRGALISGLNAHVEEARRTVRHRRWQKVVQMFIL
ncbi:unnamed protein product, partial [Choristocarpus tenellus]